MRFTNTLGSSIDLFMEVVYVPGLSRFEPDSKLQKSIAALISGGVYVSLA